MIISISESHEDSFPLVVSVPHAGKNIPDELLEHFTKKNKLFLTSDTDLYVNELYKQTPNIGGTLIVTNIARSVIDPNRDANARDASFVQGGPETASPLFLGLVPQKTMKGEQLLKAPLTQEQLNHRIKKYYQPFHAALRNQIDITVKRYGYCIHIDAHSMPSVGNVGHVDSGSERPDMDLGDCYGKSCDEKLIATIENCFQNAGLSTSRNEPYKGGFITQNYGRPDQNIHTIQIEINRALYVNEETHEKLPEKFEKLSAIITSMLEEVKGLSL